MRILREKKIEYFALGFILLLLTASDASAHSGRTDSSGGHNCYVGACAGTYHYHNGGSAPAPYVPPKIKSTPKLLPTPTPTPRPKPTMTPTPTPTPTPIPTSSPTMTPNPEVKGISIAAEITPAPFAANPSNEVTDGNIALGLGVLTTMIGGGYWAFKKYLK